MIIKENPRTAMPLSEDDISRTGVLLCVDAQMHSVNPATPISIQPRKVFITDTE